MVTEPPIVVVGAGITGLTAAHTLLTLLPGYPVEVLDSATHAGGKIRTSAFAGLPAVDEAADAYLLRVPAAATLAREVGVDSFTNPTATAAAVWHGGLHPLPEGLLLGVPTAAWPLVRSGLLSWKAAMRAATEPLRRRSPTDHDCLGRWARDRFGDEVHTLLVDPLVGSIYAADTDRFSLATVPQLASIANSRSALLAARRLRRAGRAATGPVFEAPTGGMGTLIEALVRSIVARGGTVRTGFDPPALEASPDGLRMGGNRIAGAVLACPARAASNLLASASPEAAAGLARVEAAPVVMVTISVPHEQWRRGRGGNRFSGYLVPKPDQRHVTAVSFASNKWSHWRPADGAMVLRVSLGRDGLPAGSNPVRWDDDRLIDTVIAEVGDHLGFDLAPTAVRISRWPDAFPQYRPGHLDRLVTIEGHLRGDAPGVVLAGASHRGMGIPACVQQGRQAAAAIAAHVVGARD